MPGLSIVIPAHNEASNISVIFREIKSVIEQLPVVYDWELIFVDDGSSDNTVASVKELIGISPNVKLVRLSRNFGHQAALMAGIVRASGDAVITMDCDLQHPPYFIPEMLKCWESGDLVVEMLRERTIGISHGKKMFSSAFYKFINKLSSIQINEGVSDFRLLDRFVVAQLVNINDPKPFIRGLVAWLGFKARRINYVAEERRHGQPSYNFKKSLKLAHQALLLLSHEPLRFSIYGSIFLAVLSFLYVIYVLAMVILGQVVSGWPSIIISVLVLGAVQLLSLGVLGEYVAQVFERTRNLPPYVALPDNTLDEGGGGD